MLDSVPDSSYGSCAVCWRRVSLDVTVRIQPHQTIHQATPKAGCQARECRMPNAECETSVGCLCSCEVCLSLVGLSRPHELSRELGWSQFNPDLLILHGIATTSTFRHTPLSVSSVQFSSVQFSSGRRGGGPKWSRAGSDSKVLPVNRVVRENLTGSDSIPNPGF